MHLVREYLCADGGCDGVAISGHDKDMSRENAIINQFLASPDALSVLARILSELAEASSIDAEEEIEQH
jgi:hypothetical protein